MLSVKARGRVVAAVIFCAALPAMAADIEDRNYDKAMELHQHERYQGAAARFMASYDIGYRQQASAYNAACALAQAGLTDDAFQWLDKAYAAGFDLEDYLDDDDDLRSLRGDPRFAALRARVTNGRGTKEQREGESLAQKYRALAGQKGADAGHLDELGRELLRHDRYEEAAGAFERAAAMEDDPASTLYNAACARSLNRQKPQALDLLQRAVERGFTDAGHIDSDDDLDNIRGEARFKQLRALAVELDTPNYPGPNHDREAQTRQKWQAALPRVEAAARNHPQLGLAWFNLGMAYIAIERGDLAVQPMERAVALGYRKASSTYNVACAHSLAGHSDAAFAWLDKALAAGFDNWWLLREDADLDGIRTDPRFRRFLDLARQHERD